MFLNCSTCFERHIAHHQELKNCICSLWFLHTSVGAGRSQSWVPTQFWKLPTPTDVCKTRGYKYSCWASDDERCVAWNMLSNKKLWNNKILLHSRILLVISVWFIIHRIHFWGSFLHFLEELSCHSTLKSHLWCFILSFLHSQNWSLSWPVGTAVITFRSALFWDVTQRIVVAAYRLFETSHRFHLQEHPCTGTEALYRPYGP